MFSSDTQGPTRTLAEQAVDSTRRVTNHAFDGLADSVQGVRQDVAPMLERAAGEVGAMAQRGRDVLRSGTHQLQDQARRVSHRTVDYVRDEPMKSILIAAATGAALMALVGMLSRSHDRR